PIAPLALASSMCSRVFRYCASRSDRAGQCELSTSILRHVAEVHLLPFLRLARSARDGCVSRRDRTFPAELVDYSHENGETDLDSGSRGDCSRARPRGGDAEHNELRSWIPFDRPGIF